ncbi:uncharacterized protein Pyn_03890 [Prunus yedoensis var. nudiflora]|uniref:Uncharacterized protein n=1 Tax=Prunus yedoensis var. nudiflora TaxID=2094558 RepID=A0A314UDG1_PRUYE|nr:uncharacterized protein Pyn_03890 [Prunus yedoensis var. nudiflora]
MQKVFFRSQQQQTYLHTDPGSLFHRDHHRRCVHYRLRKLKDQKIIPRLKISDSSRVQHKLERFPHYVARQLGFKDRRECPHLCKLATEYIRKFEGFEDDIYNFFSSEPDADSLFVKLVGV